jgi:TPR repeat protein
MKKAVYRLGLAVSLAILADGAMARTDGERAAQDVGARLRASDCEGAVKALNAGLKQDYAEVALLAGSMYENGVCVPSDWKRAVSFYSQAYEGGQAEAASRLAAGFAAPENGPDIAAALWWANRGRVQAAQMQANAGCAVSPEAAGDPDLFVAELRTWPQARLLLCNYIAGVMSTLAAEVQYPSRAIRAAMGSDVFLRFQPAVPRIDMLHGESREYQQIGFVDGNKIRPRDTRRLSDSFQTAIGEVADRALRRYPQPAGIPEQTRIQVKYIFNIKYTR